MSDSENLKVQDMLRGVADSGIVNIACVLTKLQDALDIEYDGSRTWGDDVRVCLREIADRIDRQSVVEVTTPAPAKDPFDEVAKLYPLSAGEVQFVLDHYIASGCTHVPIKPESETAAPSIYLNNCTIHVHGGADDQIVQPLD